VTASPVAKSVERRYVFLASSPYSGSTLFSYLLAAHPRIATVSDVSGTRRAGQMDTFECSCGRRMRDCPFWAELRERAAARGLEDLDLADFRLGFDHHGSGPLAGLRSRSLRWSSLENVRDVALAPLGTWRSMRQIGERSWAFANALLDMEDADVFVDASKERLRIRNLRRHLPATPFVIHLVRDVRGVVDSTIRRADQPVAATKVARTWGRTNDSILRQLDELPADHWLRVRYEDLCADVDGVMRRVYRFCGVDPNLPLQPVGAEMHLLGNRMRLSAPRSVTLDERWRSNITSKEQGAIVRAAGKAFRVLYPERVEGHGEHR
jgi:hypothetical protein